MRAGGESGYRGRLAPSPTGLLHQGHARTFWIAHQRARERGGVVVLRNDDLDSGRCRPEFVRAMIEDLRWLGVTWEEGPDVGGPHAPYDQSGRMACYREAFGRLREMGCLYPCRCSRQDVRRAASAPHPEDDEPIYPGTCRDLKEPPPGRSCSWRFRVEAGARVAFEDGACGAQAFLEGRDFGDFVVWRPDGVPAYHLACVVDDALMGITEVVRGQDLLRSTARQILLFRALGWREPCWYHCPLVTDEHGHRLAKRHDALSLRTLRERGTVAAALRCGWTEG
ncbi:MAG: tRNA glutamyl-Q(34) synthetase GluQRS [Verrucomicrobiales bacterium]|nr:tRNA glutamyl-Q(34) synthetase GluQRS [Verrucomicrobiales bacterium]